MMSPLQAQPSRMVREARLLQALPSEIDTFKLNGWGKTETGNLCAYFQFRVGDWIFDGVLVYPSLFPDVPAFIRPRHAENRVSRHQFGGDGVLCLEYGPDNWVSTFTGADLVRSAHKLFWSELISYTSPRRLKAPLSRHEQNAAQEARFKPYRFVLSTGFQELLRARAVPSLYPLEIHLSSLDGVRVAVPTCIGDVSKMQVAEVPASGWPGACVQAGWLVIAQGEVLHSVDLNLQALRAQLGELWPIGARDANLAHEYFIVVHSPTNKLRAFQVDASERLTEYHLLDFSNDKGGRLPENFRPLADAHVAIVGAGSLGGKIAVSMARAGARRFTLVDEDILGAANLVRNALDWRSVGFNKVDALKRDIELVAPGVMVEATQLNIGAQENPGVMARLYDALTECSLVIDATANPHAFLTLSALCKSAKLPMVWGEVFAGGFGSQMARSRPGLDGDAASIRACIHAYMAQLEPVPGQEAQDARRYAMAVDGQVLVGSDADVSALAASMTQFAIDTLCAGEQSEYPVAAYLMGYRKFWEFKQPFDTIPIDCSATLLTPEKVQLLCPEDAQILEVLQSAMEGSPRVAADTAS